MEWTVHQGSGRLLVFTNQNGETVSDVKMTLRGKRLVGQFPPDVTGPLRVMKCGRRRGRGTLQSSFRSQDRPAADGDRSMTPVTKPRWLHSEIPSARRALNARGSRARPCPPRTIAYAQRGAGERKPGPVERR
jgi:hypothetical protein